jgi:hypothetical protein
MFAKRTKMTSKRIPRNAFDALGTDASKLIQETLRPFHAIENGGGGDCGYYSVATAIERSNLFPEKQGEQLMMQLRSWTADYVRDHFDQMNKDHAFLHHDRTGTQKETYVRADGKTETKTDIVVRNRFENAEQASTSIRKKKGDWMDEATLAVVQNQLFAHNIPLYILLVTAPLVRYEMEASVGVAGTAGANANIHKHDVVRYAATGKAPPTNDSKVCVVYRSQGHFQLLELAEDRTTIFDAITIESKLRKISTTFPTPIRIGVLGSGIWRTEYSLATILMEKVMKNFVATRCKWIFFKERPTDDDHKFVSDSKHHQLVECDMDKCFDKPSLLDDVTFHMIFVMGTFSQSTPRFEDVMQSMYRSIKPGGLFIEMMPANGVETMRKYFHQSILLRDSQYHAYFRRNEIKPN